MANPCSFCSAECCKTYFITTTVFDILRICKNTGSKAEDFAVLHESRLLGFDPDLVLETTDGYGRYLLGIRSHPCIFLQKNNRCTIHAFAPLSCREYPFTLAGTFNGRFCPLLPAVLLRLKGPDIRKERMTGELESYKAIVKEWNARRGKKQDCIRVLLELASSAYRA
ncbi:MAG: YkgJ family cysteine cluster protein [Candidatus Aenigmatarchaeota archaeon]